MYSYMELLPYYAAMLVIGFATIRVMAKILYRREQRKAARKPFWMQDDWF